MSRSTRTSRHKSLHGGCFSYRLKYIGKTFVADTGVKLTQTPVSLTEDETMYFNQFIRA